MTKQAITLSLKPSTIDYINKLRDEMWDETGLYISFSSYIDMLVDNLGKENKIRDCKLQSSITKDW